MHWFCAMLPLKIYQYYLPVIILLLPTVKTGLGFEYSVIPALFASVIGLITYSFRPSMTFIEFVAILIAVLSFIVAVLLNNIDGVKEAMFFITLSAGVLYARVANNDSVALLAERLLLIYCVVGLADIFVPGFSSVKSLFLTRSFVENVGVRGVSSLATEPSYFVLVVFSLWMLHYSSRGFTHITHRFFIVGLVCMLISKSSMAILVFPLFIISSGISYKKLTIISMLVLVFFSFWQINQYQYSYRFMQFLMLLGNGYDAVLLDQSAGSRLLYIIKDLYLSFQLFLLPFGPATYESLISLSDIPRMFVTPAGFKYNILQSGSLAGRFLVEYGAFFIIAIGFIFFKTVRRIGSMRSLLITAFMVSILFQMISLVFAPIAFSFGGWFFYVLYGRRCR